MKMKPPGLSIVYFCLSTVFFSGADWVYPDDYAAESHTQGKWLSVHSMQDRRAAHTATLLPDGKVLIAGGLQDWYEFGLVIPFSETFNPATGCWESTGEMSSRRAYHTATLLPDGTVLVAGGWNSTWTNRSAEIYDPASRTWSLTHSLSQRRLGHTATLLADGKVLVAGGIIEFMDTIDSAEIFDPVSRTWTPTEPMPASRGLHTATLLSDGRVLIWGGLSTSRFILPPGGDLFDPATGRWSTIPPDAWLPTKDGCAIQLPLDGHPVYLVGGSSSAGYSNHSILFYPETQTWRDDLSPLCSPRNNFTLTMLPTEALLAVGGINFSGFPDSEILRFFDMTWRPTSPMVKNRSMHTATLLSDGRVLVTGGMKDDEVLSDTEIFYPEIQYRTYPASTANCLRSRHTSSLLVTGDVLVAGGCDTSGAILDKSAIFRPHKNRWAVLAPMSEPRSEHTASCLSNQVVLIGGRGKTGILSSVDCFDSSRKTWNPAPPMAHQRVRHCAVVLADGRILVTGGNDGYRTTTTCEIYDPAEAVWKAVPDMNEARESHTASLLVDGRILVTGGKNGYLPLATTEIFDPSTEIWSTQGSMKTARMEHQTSPLPDGRVLISGGKGENENHITCEIFEPQTGIWRTTSDLPHPRSGHVSFLLRNGSVIVFGGSTKGETGLKTVEAFDPILEMWTRVSELNWEHQDFAATLLADSRILLSGGWTVQNRKKIAAKNEILACDVPISWTGERPYLDTITWNSGFRDSLQANGRGFRGHGMSEGCGGNFRGSPTNYPLLQLFHVSSGNIFWLHPDPGDPFTNTSFTSHPRDGLPVGPAVATIFVQGQPSNSRIVQSPEHETARSVVRHRYGCNIVR